MFINLTQHKMTEEQTQDALQVLKNPIHNVEPLNEVVQLITFNELPDYRLIQSRASSVANIAQNMGAKYALIAGAPFFMSSLEKELVKRGITFVYAYSNRVSIEREIDGKIEKTTVFKHQGWIF